VAKPKRKEEPKSPSEIRRVYAVPPLPARPAHGHKGMFGRVLVVGGDEAMFGAALLAATAALRCGSGLVQVAVPRGVLPSAMSITPELIGLPLDEKSDRTLAAAASAADALVVGPGMGQTNRARKRILALLKHRKPTVVDADALNILASEKKWPRELQHTILTPHPGEMLRLGKRIGIGAIPTDPRGRVDVAMTASQKLGAIVLLKGERTIVTDGTRAYINSTGNSTLSKAGSGDVLAGVIGSLLGQGMTAFDAACAGARLHGRAGEIAGEHFGARSAVARDVISSLAAAFTDYSL